MSSSQVISHQHDILSDYTQGSLTSFTNNIAIHSETVNYKATLKVRTLRVLLIRGDHHLADSAWC